MSKSERDILFGALRSCLPQIIGFILAVIACAVITWLCSSCKSQKVVTETIHHTDTLKVRHDSIIIQDRYVPVEIPVPASSQIVDLLLDHDSTSVLEDDLYRSTARVSGGRLQHTLQSKPEAKLAAPVIVHDTVKIMQDSIKTNNQDTQHDVQIKEVNKLLWWQKILMVLGGIMMIICALAVAWYMGKKQQSKSK